jgi:site-specific DNA-methyltransferase (adenine-specific)
MIGLRCGDWRTALADVGEVSCVITDPPYGQRTHAGQGVGQFDHGHRRTEIEYSGWTDDNVGAFIASWAPRCTGWMCCFTSHDLAPSYADHMSASGRYVFAPVPWVNEGGPIRLSGDGPSSWTCWLIVSRPKNRDMQRWGTLPGAYIHNSCKAQDVDAIVMGAKPLGLMRRIVRDYSRPGDLVVDPCAGGATTLLAAAMEGRRAIGAELDPATYKKAQARLSKGYTPTMFET